jgi:hypothetical protein
MQLIDDHEAIDRILKELQTALRAGDIKTVHARLDLFWARLAVHIRAEHLHLFTTVLSHTKKSSLAEARTVIAQLRLDHDFFMHQLALAVAIMRELLTLPVQVIDPEGLNNVENIILEVEERLLKHNDLEETKVYHWATILLNSEEQATLASQIETELHNRPPRFALSTWINETVAR